VSVGKATYNFELLSEKMQFPGFLFSHVVQKEQSFKRGGKKHISFLKAK